MSIAGEARCPPAWRLSRLGARREPADGAERCSTLGEVLVLPDVQVSFSQVFFCSIELSFTLFGTLLFTAFDLVAQDFMLAAFFTW